MPEDLDLWRLPAVDHDVRLAGSDSSKWKFATVALTQEEEELVKRTIAIAAVAFAIPSASHACENKEYAQIKDELAAQGRDATLKQYCRTFTEAIRATKAHAEMALTVQKLAAYGGADRATVERAKAVQADAEVCRQQSLKLMTALGLTLETAQYKVCAEDGNVLTKENNK